MPQRDLLLPWRSALDNAGLALELGGVRRREARRRRRRAVRALRARRVRRRAPGRAVRRYAPARGVRAHAARRASRPAAGRAVCVAGRDHARGAPGVDRRSARRGAAHGAAGDARHRGGALPLRPRAGALGAAGTRARSSCPGCPRSRRPAQRDDHLGRVLPPARSARWRHSHEPRRTPRAEWAPPALLLAAARGGLGGRGTGGLGRELPAACAQRGRPRAGRRPGAAARGRLGHGPGGAARFRACARGRCRDRGCAARLRAAAAGRLSPGRRLPGRARGGDRSDPRDLVRVRHDTQADRDRTDLLLPDRRQHPRRPARGRPGAGEDAAHARGGPLGAAAPPGASRQRSHSSSRARRSRSRSP